MLPEDLLNLRSFISVVQSAVHPAIRTLSTPHCFFPRCHASRSLSVVATLQMLVYSLTSSVRIIRAV